MTIRRAERWRARLVREESTPVERSVAMRAVNPAIIPRNHRIEQAIEAASERDDYAPFEALVGALARPFDDDPLYAHLKEPPAPDERVTRTFCGT